MPAVTYNETIPGPSMPGWAAWVWDKTAHRLSSAVTNLGSRVGLAAAPNLTITGEGSVIYECLVSVVSSAVSGGADPVHSAYTHVERAMYLGGHNLYSKPTPAKHRLRSVAAQGPRGVGDSVGGAAACDRPRRGRDRCGQRMIDVFLHAQPRAPLQHDGGG